ncbi:MAG: hypothetical protein QQN45_05770 [Nitrosopumilus sp.]
MVEDESVNLSKSKSQLGKIGVVLMVIGMIILYADGARLYLTVPAGYQFYEHPEIHIPIIGFIVAFLGTGIFIYNFSKERNVI